MTCDAWNIVVVPFPFADGPGDKRRPALVLSRRDFNSHGHTVVAMITTKSRPPWPGDTKLKDVDRAGLRASCIVRLKIFTLDNRLVLKEIGSLSDGDRKRTTQSLRASLGSSTGRSGPRR